MVDYQKFWKIAGPVFNRRMDAAQVYFSQILKRKIEKLNAIVKQPKAVTVIHGVPGSGKTLLASWLHGYFEFKAHEVLLLLPALPSIEDGWLLGKICQFMCGSSGVNQSAKKQFRLTSIAMDQLIEEGRTLIVIIDNAEKLVGSAALEELSALFAIQALSGHCLSFILIGDSTLEAQLATLPKLASVISFIMEIPAIPEAEVGKYLEYYTKKADLKQFPFTAEAVAAIAAISKGSPGTINRIAETCFIESASMQERSITDRIVMQACQNVLPNFANSKNYKLTQNSERIEKVRALEKGDASDRPIREVAPIRPVEKRREAKIEPRENADKFVDLHAVSEVIDTPVRSKITEKSGPIVQPANPDVQKRTPPKPFANKPSELGPELATAAGIDSVKVTAAPVQGSPAHDPKPVEAPVPAVINQKPKTAVVKNEQGVINLSSLFKNPEKKKAPDSGNGTEK